MKFKKLIIATVATVILYAGLSIVVSAERDSRPWLIDICDMYEVNLN